jgi:hypothetical protein
LHEDYLVNALTVKFPDGTIGHARYTANEKGGMDGAVLVDLFKKNIIDSGYFKEGEINEGNPLIVLLDGHVSRLHLPLLRYCVQHHIIPMVGVPNSTHLTQTLDADPRIFATLKTLFTGKMIEAMTRQALTAHHVDQLQGLVARHFNKLLEDPFEKTFNMSSIRGSFKTVGLIPFTQGPYFKVGHC